MLVRKKNRRRRRQRRDTLTWRYPIAVSSSFGLLHGLGFAAVWGDIGLPQTEIPAALLFFNIGVELGQILFVMPVLSGFFAVKWMIQQVRHASTLSLTNAMVQRSGGYVVGTLATFWMIERVAGFWS